MENSKNSTSEQAPGQNKVHTITVNTRQKEFTGQKISYTEVVQLAFPNEQPTDIIDFTVTYVNPNGHGDSLVNGQSVHVTEGMVFDVDKTNRS